MMVRMIAIFYYIFVCYSKGRYSDFQSCEKWLILFFLKNIWTKEWEFGTIVCFMLKHHVPKNESYLSQVQTQKFEYNVLH